MNNCYPGLIYLIVYTITAVLLFTMHFLNVQFGFLEEFINKT
jgi:hypothetical protein